MFRIELAKRIKELPPYLFAEIDRLKQEMEAKGADVIDLGVGDPDLPTPDNIVEWAKEAVGRPQNHCYPSYEGMREFREAVAVWMKRRFGVELDPATEVMALIGSKEGIAHIPLAFINPGDLALVPSPGYPVYSTSVSFCGGRSFFMPLREERGFLPDFEEIPEKIRRRARLMFINYPNNPTAAVADIDFFERVVSLARKERIIVCHDAAYSEVYYNDTKPPSLLEVPGAKDVGIEFHSLSKTFNMTGWRIGWACGNREIVSALRKVKTNIDSGVFQAVQEAAIAALSSDQTPVERMRKIYQERRDILIAGLRKAGVEVEPPRATFYVWAKVPEGYNSKDFCAHLLSQTGIVATPGVGFGEAGEGYIRFSLTLATERIKEAAERIEKLGGTL